MNNDGMTKEYLLKSSFEHNVKIEEWKRYMVQKITSGSYAYSREELLSEVFSIADNEREQIELFNYADHVNTKHRNWLIWRRDKENNLGRCLTPHEEWLSHQPAEITEEKVQKLIDEEEHKKMMDYLNKLKQDIR